MQIEPVFSCDACGLPRGPLSPIPGEGGPRHLCPSCLHAFVAGEVSAMEGRMGIKGGESMDDPAGEIVDAIREGRRVRREGIDFSAAHPDDCECADCRKRASYAPSRPCVTCGEPLAAWAKVCHACEKRAAEELTRTQYPDGTPRDWVTMELRAADYRTLNQLANTWQCSRDNALGMLCRAVRMQVWPLGDVLTSLPEFHAWVERLVHAEQGPLREAFRRANPEEQAAMDRELPHRGRRSVEPVAKDSPRAALHHRCHGCDRLLDQWGGYYCPTCMDKMTPEERRQYQPGSGDNA